ncbi:hypothetical protein [Spiroplasma sp. AdecLV25b]|uniref:hypothetical protein n=1 Tax=Spiroplasma sp. AdecLV25b TaxID=3027162 RepID=UPI0027E04D88|nr:hypothetical protein [Spiroplasma sp. AdecLV25b]
MNKDNFRQLVIVCRDYKIDFNQFINPIYVGVETGIINLLKHNKTMAFICGDNDTITKQQLSKVIKDKKNLHLESIVFNSVKDQLDSELAIILALERKLNFQQIVLVADGTRWDMLMASINICLKYQQYNLILVGENNYCFMLKNNQHYTFTQHQLTYDYISFFNYGIQPVIYNFSGCKYYPNQDIIINANDTQSFSNEFLILPNQTPNLKIKQGNCLIFLHKNIR